MRFFGVVLVSVGFLGAVLSISVGVIESLSAAPGASANAALIFAILAAGAFAGGAALLAGGMVCRFLDRQEIYLERLVDATEPEYERHPAQAASAPEPARPSVVRLGGPGPRASAF